MHVLSHTQILGFNAYVCGYVDISVGRGYEVRKVSETHQKEMSKRWRGQQDTYDTGNMVATVGRKLQRSQKDDEAEEKIGEQRKIIVLICHNEW